MKKLFLVIVKDQLSTAWIRLIPGFLHISLDPDPFSSTLIPNLYLWHAKKTIYFFSNISLPIIESIVLVDWERPTASFNQPLIQGSGSDLSNVLDLDLAYRNYSHQMFYTYIYISIIKMLLKNLIIYE